MGRHIGALWVGATALAFAAGAEVAGYALGALFVGVAGVLTTTGFCIPSFIFRACETQIVARREAT
jgi:hypothetical protein